MSAPDPALLRASTEGDPLADAVAAEVLADRSVRRQFAAALTAGSDAPAVTSAAVRALVEQMERAAAGAPDSVVLEDARAAHTVPIAAHAFDVGAGALVNSYRPPGAAAVLVGTGRLLDDTYRRLLDTAGWLNAASVPGWLRPGRPGYVATGHVRLAHAVVRRQASAPGRLEVSQLDVVRTWLDFTLVAPRCAARLGLGLTEAEHVALLRYWRLLGELLGADPDLLAQAVDRRSAEDLEARVVALYPPPSEDSRRLTLAGLTAVATGLGDMTRLPPRASLLAVQVVARAMHGREVSDALGIPRAGGAHRLVPLVAVVLRTHRAWRRRDPVAWRAAVDRNIAAGEEFVRSGGQPPPPRGRAARPRVPAPADPRVRV
ncbi:oxygenase MpaB family protein [Kineococcus sp. NUM-3379]